MKRRNLLIILATMFLVTNIYGENNVLAPSKQSLNVSLYNHSSGNYFTFHFGPTFPLGNFGGDDANDWIFNTLNNKAEKACASIGVNLGIQYKYSLPIDGLGITISGDLFFNGMKDCIQNDYYDDIEQLGYKIKSKYRYYNIPILLGVNYQYSLNRYFAAYAEAAMGIDIRYISNFKYTHSILETTETYKINTDVNVAGQCGIGIVYNDLITLGAHFYFLGSDNIKETYTLERYGHSTDTDIKTDEKLHTNMFTIQLGLRF